LDADPARGISTDLLRTTGLTVRPVGHAVDVDRRRDWLIGERFAALDAGGFASSHHHVARSVSLRREFQFLIEARLFVAIDNELAILRRKAIRCLTYGERVFTTRRRWFNRVLAGADAPNRLMVRTLDGSLVLVAEQLRVAAQQLDFFSRGLGENV